MSRTIEQTSLAASRSTEKEKQSLTPNSWNVRHEQDSEDSSPSAAQDTTQLANKTNDHDHRELGGPSTRFAASPPHGPQHQGASCAGQERPSDAVRAQFVNFQDCTVTQGRSDQRESDAGAGPVMDGMAEFTDSPVVCGSSAPPTIHFALEVQASLNATNEVSNPALLLRKPQSSDKGVSPNCSEFLSDLSTEADAGAEAASMADLASYLKQSDLQFMPQRKVAKALIDQYFSAVHPVWPFLIEQTTRRRFEETVNLDGTPSPLWMAQLNLMFALACQFDDNDVKVPLKDLAGAGEQFYLRANAFITAHAFRTCSIGMVQTLLLAAQYQQGTMRAEECWLTIGHATRMALGLGLHTAGRGGGQMEVEIRKRLWWGCFSLDRYVLLTSAMFSFTDSDLT